MTRDEAMRGRMRQALDTELSSLDFTARQKEDLFTYATGGKKMKLKMSLGLVLAIVLTLLMLGAAAAMLLSAREVIEKNAVPLAQENDTAQRRVESYTHDQLVELIRTANENGITLDENTGIMQALRKGEGYWEDEAIMEICREAFGGLIYEWTWDEQYWYVNLMAEMNGYESDMPYPGENDLTAEQARAAAKELVQARFGQEAADIENPAVYRRYETFGEDGLWIFTYQPLDLAHTKFIVSVDREGHAEDEITDCPQDWSSYSVGQLENAVNEAYRARTGTKYSWSQEAWHAFSEKLPGADREAGWSMEYDAYLLQGYPLPAEQDLTAQAAREIAAGDLAEQEVLEWQQVLMEKEGRRIWKVTGSVRSSMVLLSSQQSWEIDARSGEILKRIAWQPGDASWQAYVLDDAYRQARQSLLTGDAAVKLAADAVRKQLNEEIPLEDPACFDVRVNYLERRGWWSVEFRTKVTAYGDADVRITEPDHTVAVTECESSQVDGDSLYRRYKQVYGANRWQQDTWVKFAADMRQYEPQGWEGKLLKATGYPEESSVKMTRTQAVDIAFAHNEIQEEEELDATLIAAAPHPVWKVVLGGEEVIWLYEIDTETGEVLDKEAFKPDDYAFDNPLKRFTLHRDYAPAYVKEFGVEQLARIEVLKAFGDMTYDEPMFPWEEANEGVAYYDLTAEGRTVTFRPRMQGIPGYRITFTEGWLTESVEEIPPEQAKQ